MHRYGQPLGYQAITLSTAGASGMTIPSVTAGGASFTAALVRVETANARWRDDGTAATTGTTGGMPILTSDSMPLWLEGAGVLKNFSAIAQTGSPILHILYFGSP